MSSLRSSSPPARKKSVLHSVITALFIIVNLGIAVGTTVSAYAGAINPVVHPTAPAIAMTFPYWLTGSLLCGAVTLFVRLRVALITVAALLASAPQILRYSPFHLPVRADDESATFSLMSYNVYGLIDQNGTYYGDVNPTLSYILDRDPDIVCLQELSSLHTSSDTRVTAAQIDSIHCQYPYVFIGSHAQAIFSKFPIEPVNTGFKYSGVSGSADMACFRAEIKGRKVTIFNVHLQSFDLVDSDRRMFARLKRLQGSEAEIADMRHHLINKIREAGPQRVRDTEQLIRYIRKFGGPNVIICGDFNDVPGCYPLRMLDSEHFSEVYSQTGFGPMVTYNTGGFNFRIDHILYRGDLRPIDMSRGSIRSSDHYPVTATFEIINPK